MLWTLGALLFVAVKMDGVSGVLLEDIYHVTVPVDARSVYDITLLLGICEGVILGVFHSYIYPRIIRKQKFVLSILFRSVVSIFFLSLISFAIIELYSNGIRAWTTATLWNRLISLPLIFFGILIDSLAGIIILLRRHMGYNYFINLFNGVYLHPKEEHRVFMFLDMQDSTPTAELLGHLRFSQLIQECFNNLSGITDAFGGAVYQFVGDEAVITWKVHKRFDYARCLNLYFRYCQVLAAKATYYKEKFNVLPKFKCAIHEGNVSIAIVGDHKPEIAFHGEVLNTCARIQAKCKEYHEDVLISEAFYEHISTLPGFIYSQKKNVSLKGVGRSQQLYSVRKIA